MPNDSVLKGSVYINNSSYAGTDIKVLVHTYDPNASAQIRYKALKNEIKVAQVDYDTINSRLSALQTKIASLKQGTPEMTRCVGEINTLKKKLQDSFDVLNDLKLSGGSPGDLLNPSYGAVKVLLELQTLSISTNRDKQQVRALGHVSPKGHTRGPRDVAGSMIFTVFNKHVLEEFMVNHATEFDGSKYGTAIADQIPPLDVTVVFANEYGHTSRMSIYGVEFFREGMVLSVEDILTESTMNFMARDFDPMRSVAERKIDENCIMQAEWAGKKASDLIFEEDNWDTNKDLDPFYRFKVRQNPFI